MNDATADGATTLSVPRLTGLRARTTHIKWMFAGASAVLDQGLFAVSNFGINILLVRWLTPEDCGAFAIAYAVFLTVGAVYNALLTDPLLVFGPGKFATALPRYFAVILQSHWRITAAGSVLLACTAGVLVVLGERTLGVALLAAAAATPFMLLLWLMRRSCYMRVQSQIAALAGLFYLVVTFGGAHLLYRTGLLSTPSALILMGSGSLAAALGIRSALSFDPGVPVSSDFRRSVVSAHWQYGRWTVGSGVAGMFILNAYYLLMPGRYGLEGAATFKALMNLVMPAMQSFWALSMLVVPQLVHVRDTPSFRRLMSRLIGLYVTAALLYWVAVGSTQTYLLSTLYNGQYTAAPHLLWLLGLVPVACAVISVLESALWATERSPALFRAYLLAGVSTLLVGVPLMMVWGLSGAVIGTLIAHGCLVGSMGFSLRGRLRPA